MSHLSCACHSAFLPRVLFFYYAVALFSSGRLQAALNIWENICLVKYRELLGTHPFTASLLDHIGKIYQALGKPRRAVALKKESLRMRHLLLGMPGLYYLIYRSIIILYKHLNYF